MKRGFTLLEIIVATALILTFVALGLASFSSNNKRQRQVAAFSEFRQTLQLAKNNATSGKKPATCTATLLGWRVRLSANSYSVEAICENSYPLPIPTPYLTRTVNLPTGVTLSVNPPTVTEILFRALGQGTATNLSPAVITSNTVISVTDQIDVATVTVTDRGEIQ